MATAVRASQDAGGGDPTTAAPHAGNRRGWWTGRRVLAAAGVLVVAQLALRSWVVWTGTFHDDDLTMAGRSVLFPIWSSDFLLYDHGGHFMPGAYVVAGYLTQWAPLEWWPAALSIVVLQLLASLAVLRLLRVLLGPRPALLLALGFYLLSPLTLPSFAWWAAALNALPLQAGLAWVVADAVLLTRTGRWRYAVSGVLVFALALAMFEKSVVIPWVAFAVVVLLGRSAARPIRSALRRGAPLWIGTLAVSAVWLYAYVSVVGSPASETQPAADLTLQTARRGLTEGLLPPLLGGPWEWERSFIFAPWATPPLALSVAAVLVAVGGILVTSARRRGVWMVWLLVLGYAAASLAAMVMVRLYENMADTVPGTLRYFADSAVVLVIAGALIALSPVRGARPADRPGAVRTRRVLVGLAAGAVAVSSVWSTVTFQRIWTDTRTDDYLATVRATLAAAGDVPLLPEPVPVDIRWQMAHPQNFTSRILAPLPDRPPFADSTPELRILDEAGRLRPGRIQEPTAEIVPGPEAGCGYRLGDDGAVTLPFTGYMLEWVWTAELDYTADRDGMIEVTLPSGEPAVRVPVEQGSNTVFVRLNGGGDGMQLTSTTPGLSVCVSGGMIGNVEFVPGE